MKVISTTVARKSFAHIIERIKMRGGVVAIGRRNRAEVLIIPYPQILSDQVSEITNINANSKSFEFLNDEPELYSITDLKKRYA